MVENSDIKYQLLSFWFISLYTLYFRKAQRLLTKMATQVAVCPTVSANMKT